MTNQQLEANADIVAKGLESQWRNAYVIACSVRMSGSSADAEKASVQAFADMIKAHAGGRVYGMGVSGIRASLRKWDRVAADSGLPTSSELRPSDATKDVEYPDRSWYEEKGSPHSEKTKLDDIRGNPTMVADAAKGSPTLAKAIVEALASDPETAWQAAETLAKAQPETVVAVADAERSRAGELFERDLTRGHKEREAHDTEAKLIVGPAMFNGPFMALHAAIVDMQEAGVHDEESAAYARTLAAALRESATLVEAWADRLDQPLSDEEFASGIEAILGGTR